MADSAATQSQILIQLANRSSQKFEYTIKSTLFSFYSFADLHTWTDCFVKGNWG